MPLLEIHRQGRKSGVSDAQDLEFLIFFGRQTRVRHLPVIADRLQPFLRFTFHFMRKGAGNESVLASDRVQIRPSYPNAAIRLGADEDRHPCSQ